MFLELKDFILAFRARRFYPRSINKKAGRFHLRTIIGWLYTDGKKLEGLILAFGTKGFYSCSSIDMLDNFILTLLLEVTGEEKKDGRA